MTTQLLVIVLLVLCSAFCSGSETALASAQESRLVKRAQKSGAAKTALWLYHHDDKTLMTVLVANNLVNAASGSVATVLIIDWLGDGYSYLATVGMTVLILCFGEITPKLVAKRIPEAFACLCAVPLSALYWVLSPLVWALNGLMRGLSHLWVADVTDNDAVSEDDLETVLDLVEDEGVLDEEACDLLQNALDFSGVLAYEVITPRVDMVAIDIRDPFDKNKQILLESPYSRIPVYEDTPDKIIGILHLNRFFKEMVNTDGSKIALRPLLKEPVFVHKTMPLDEVLDKMKNERRHMVVVLDEYGGTMGILTMEDVLEQIVGDIWDESDQIEEEFICLDETHYEASGDMRVEDFFDELDLDDTQEEEYEEANVTLGGWATDCLDGNVREGATFTFMNLTVTVLSYDNMRIERLGIEVMPDKEEDP